MCDHNVVVLNYDDGGEMVDSLDHHVCARSAAPRDQVG